MSALPKTIPQNSCAYEEYDPATLVPANTSTYTRLMELGWSAKDFAGKSVLDIGGNSGILSLYAHDLGAKSVSYVDVQKPLVEFFESVVASHNLPISVARKSFLDLTVNEDTKDIVLFMEVLHWIVDQGGNIPDSIEKLASITNETLYLETPWDVNEPSIASRGKIHEKDYNIELIIKELQTHFKHVEMIRFMTYFGVMKDSKRVLIKASGKRTNSLILKNVSNANQLDISLSLGANAIELVTTPSGPMALKCLPKNSILNQLNELTLKSLFNEIDKAPNNPLVTPVEVDGSYINVVEDGRSYMLFPFVGNLANYFPEKKAPQAVKNPLSMAVSVRRVLATVSSEIFSAVKDKSRQVICRNTNEFGEVFVGLLEINGLLEFISGVNARMSNTDRELEDSIVHNDLQTGNMMVDNNGQDRVVDIDLFRSGTAYSDVLCCGMYTGASTTEIQKAIDESTEFTDRKLAQYDIDFSVSVILGWVKAIENKPTGIPEHQLRKCVVGIKSVADLTV